MSFSWVTSFEKEHLWMYLQTLGFEPAPAITACGKIVSHTHLGVNMFDKLNRDAFQIVSYFLFQTLDQSLTKEVFKLCWPPFDQKSDTEFRKHCCEWLKQISAECGGSFPQVFGSLFLSPGGPKFIHLMYHFARFVVIRYIKTHSKDSSKHFAETFNVKPQDLHKCIARSHVARNRFLKILQREDFVLQKYQENSQLSVKEVRNLRSEYTEQQNQLKTMEPYDDQSDIQEKIHKVRSLWASVNETLLFLEKEREVVSSVLSLADQYTLDGTNVAINVPRLLLDKIEKQICQLHIGNVYESGELNLLTVIQLLNEVLKVMRYECGQADQARLTIDLHFLEKETKFQRERLLDLKHMSHKLKEDLTTITHSIVEKEGEWHKKWKEILSLSPFSLVKGRTTAVDLLPPMSPLSFDPASEEVYARSILLQYPASLPDIPKQHDQENDCRRASDVLGTAYNLANSSVSFPLQPASLSDTSNVTVFEKDIKMRTSREKNETVSKKTPEYEGEDSLLSSIANNTESRAFGGLQPVKKIDPFQKEQDHLAEEVARTVLSDSPPQPSMGKELKLEELIESLVSNPFLTRSQIPRTPENLISDIRNSWRKAVEMEDNRSIEPIQMDSELREGLAESSPVLHNQREFSTTSCFSTTTVSDDSPSHLPEEKVVSDCLKCVPQKHVTSHISEPTIQSDMLKKKICCKQDVEHTALQNKLLETSRIKTFSPVVNNRRAVIGRNEGGEYMKGSDYLQASYKDSSVHKSMLWNSFQISSGNNSSSFKDSDFGILHETLPEEVCHLSFNSSSSTEANFKMEPNNPMHSSIFPEDVGEGQTTPKSDSRFQAICSRYEALKKSLTKTREETYLSNSETPERHKPELSPTPQNTQTDDMLNFLDTQDFHTDCTKPSLRMSFGERKRSVSPLIKFSPVWNKD
ncbi:HAUS augmin-like complex subunit 6 isoform X1 [Saccopteryx leptura]|uniref:HAUS augmin-like complex subunit 6 isoform X1 n=2 Tax=Saccopteryx leptura TaxID=249018 RepID=UPI00339CF262